MSDFPSQFWRDAIAGKNPDVHDGDPQPGYYREKSGNRVVYWIDSKLGIVRCHVNGQDTKRAEEMWQWVAARPVTEEAYNFHETNGKWPDEDKLAAEVAKAAKADDPITAAKTMIAAAKKQAEETYAAIDTDDLAGAAQTLRDSLNGLSTTLDKERKKLVEPHLAEQRRINGLYNPIIDSAEAVAKTLRTAMEKHENNKRAQARLAAEAAAKAAEEAARLGRPAPAPPPSNAQAPATQVKGASGKAASVGNRKVVTINDQYKVYQHFKANPVLVECLLKLAQAQANMDIPVPGTTVTTEAAIR